MRVRPEWFGGLVESGDSVVAVNRAAMRALGVTSSPRWRGPDPGRLSAPVEAQLVLSRRCTAGCSFCSVDATPDGAEMSEAAARAVLDELARRGVFTVAFGGGEPLLHPALFPLAAHARALGLWVTMTTAGLDLDDDTARACAVFHAVHVSLRPRGAPALAALARVHPRVGVNVLVEHGRLDDVLAAADLARRLSLSCLQLVRIKPAGRARDRFAERDLTAADERALVDCVAGVVRDGVRVRVDCALAALFGTETAAQIPGAAVAILPGGEARACVVDERPGGGAPLVRIGHPPDLRRRTA